MNNKTDFKLSEYHHNFDGSVLWRVTPNGVDIQGHGLVAVPASTLQRARHYLEEDGALLAQVSKAEPVPLELLRACALNEGAPAHPETSVRQEPGYISDQETPNRISAGFCQVLISTARFIMNDKSIGRDWLFDVHNSLTACARYLLKQQVFTHFDPVYAACAYNAADCIQIPPPTIAGACGSTLSALPWRPT